MSREREREVNSQKDEEVWTTVERKRLSARGSSSAIRNDGGEEGSVRKMFKDRDQFVSVFVDNLPAYMDNGNLRGLFSDCGRVRDVFVPWKWRPSMKVRYGFVRFDSFKEADEAIYLMNGRVIEGRKLVVRMVRQIGLPNQVKRRSNLEYQEKMGVEAGKGKEVRRDGRSYKDVVYGLQTVGAKRQDALKNLGAGEGLEKVGNRIVVIGKSVVEDFDSKLTFIGRIKCCKNIDATKAWFKEKSGLDVQVRCIGGPFVRVTCEAGTNVLDGINGTWPWLSDWFSSTQKWNPLFASTFRTVWLKCVGIPVGAWCSDTFCNIGKLWGEVVEVEEDVVDGVCLEEGRVLIVTEEPNFIDEFIDVVVDGRSKVVLVREDTSKISLSKLYTDGGVVEEEEEVNKVVNNKPKDVKESARLSFKVKTLKKKVRLLNKEVGGLKRILSDFVSVEEKVSDSEEKFPGFNMVDERMPVGGEDKEGIGFENVQIGSKEGESVTHVSVSSCVGPGGLNVENVVDRGGDQVRPMVSCNLELGRGCLQECDLNKKASSDELSQCKRRKKLRSFSQTYSFNSMASIAKIVRRRRRRVKSSFLSANDASVEHSVDEIGVSKSTVVMEALQTLKTAKELGVSFNENEGEVLEKCIEMERRNVEGERSNRGC